jgi:hypothetical protein
MQRAQQPQQGEPEQKRGNSSQPSELDRAHVSNVKKLEKDLCRQHEEPVQQHRSSRSRQRPQHQ